MCIYSIRRAGCSTLKCKGVCTYTYTLGRNGIMMCNRRYEKFITTHFLVFCFRFRLQNVKLHFIHEVGVCVIWAMFEDDVFLLYYAVDLYCLTG